MSAFVLIPGAGGMAWIWSEVVQRLERDGHEAISVDLPADDDSKGLHDYAGIVVRAIGGRTAHLVAQSLGGFTAPLVAARAPLRMLVLVNAMIPNPGETAGEWWKNTGAVAAREAAAKANGYGADVDLDTYFLHDVPEETLRKGPSTPRQESDAAFREPCRFERWPSIPIHVVASSDDRFFPVEFQRRVARDRLNAELETLPGGHLVPLSNPEGLAKLLVRLSLQGAPRASNAPH